MDYEERQKEIGGKIAELRNSRGIAKGELARKVGVWCKTIYKWEHGEKEIDAVHIIRIKEALCTTFDYLLLGKAEATKSE